MSNPPPALAAVAVAIPAAPAAPVVEPAVEPTPLEATAPAPPVAASPAATPVAGTMRGPGLEMDWDDENEATHVFDKKDEDQSNAPTPAAGVHASAPPRGPGPAAGVPAFPPPASGGSAPPPRPASVPPPPAQAGLNATLASPGAFGASPNTQPLALPPPPKQAPVQSRPAPAVAPARSLEQTAVVPPPATSSGSKAVLGAGLALLGVAAIAAATVFAFLPRKGTLNIRVVDQNGKSIDTVEVFMDGQRQDACQTSPCLLREITAQGHEIKVRATGYEKAEPKRVDVKGAETAIEFRLQSTAAATADTAPKESATSGSGFKVSSIGTGLHAFVDGKDRGTLPATITDLEPGTHKLTLIDSFDDVKKRHYEPFEKTITVKANEVIDLGQQTLKVTKGTVTIDIATPGAKVVLVTGKDRRAVPEKPPALEFENPKEITFEATKAGFENFSQSVDFSDGQAVKHVTITLQPKGAAPATTAAAVTGAPATTAAAPPPAALPDAMVTLNSVPPSKVVVDGKPLGDTPQKVKLSSGAHTALFINSDQGLRKSAPFTVKGKDQVVVVRLKD